MLSIKAACNHTFVYVKHHTDLAAALLENDNNWAVDGWLRVFTCDISGSVPGSERAFCVYAKNIQTEYSANQLQDNYTCSCGNSKCNTNEKSCWRCGAAIKK